MEASLIATWGLVIVFAAVSGLAGLAGVWLMWRHESWARRHTGELITFASGLLVSGSLLHLIPRAEELAGAVSAGAWTLVAFVVLYVVESHFFPHPHARSDDADPAAHDHRHEAARFGGSAIVGLGIHSLLDGIAVGAGFSTSLLTGGVIFSLVVAHKLPVGIASMGVLYHGGHERARAVRYSAVVALLTPAAVIVSYLMLSEASPLAQGAIVAAAGGSFLYVGAADLLPEGKASGLRRNTAAFLLGVGIMVLIVLFGPHDLAGR